MRLRILSTILSDVLSHLPGAEYERAKCEDLAAQVQEQRAHIEDLARRLEYTTRQKDEAEEAHVDAYEIRLDKIEGERDAIKAQYATEKAAHGDTQRHLTAAIAERNKWQLSHGTVAREKEQLRSERDALRARVAELQAGEPVAWRVDYERVPGEHCCWFAVSPGEMKRLGPTGKLTPLYAAPQPPVFGVEGERFIAVASGQAAFIAADGPFRSIGTRAEAEATIAGTHDPKRWELLRVLPADAPVVDVAKIRAALKTLRGIRIWTAGDLQVGADAFAAIASAVGEKG